MYRCPCPTCAWPAHAGVIPLPAKIVRGSGVFEVNSATSLRVAPGDRDALSAARYLAALWKRTNGLTLHVSAEARADQTASVILFQTEPGFGPEAYRLEVASHRITVSATTAAGLILRRRDPLAALAARPDDGSNCGANHPR